MKAKSLALVVGVILGGQLPAAATTYRYLGQPYDQNCHCLRSYTAFGSKMLGTVTFNLDTSCFSGTIYGSNTTQITNLVLKSGTYSASNWLTNYFVFDRGAIVDWNVALNNPRSRHPNTLLYTNLRGDGVSHPLGFYVWEVGPGVWSPTTPLRRQCSASVGAGSPFPYCGPYQKWCTNLSPPRCSPVAACP